MNETFVVLLEEWKCILNEACVLSTMKFVGKIPFEMQVDFPFFFNPITIPPNSFSDSHRSPHFSCYRFITLVVEQCLRYPWKNPLRPLALSSASVISWWGEYKAASSRDWEHFQIQSSQLLVSIRSNCFFLHQPSIQIVLRALQANT